MFTFLLSKGRWARQKSKLETNLKEIENHTIKATQIQKMKWNEMSQIFVVQKLKGEGGRVGGKVRDLGSTKKCQEYKHHTCAIITLEAVF